MRNLTQCIKGGSLEGESGWLIKFEYNVELIEELKRAIPHIHREWREDSKTWWVSEEYNDVLKSLFGNFEALAFLQGKMF